MMRAALIAVVMLSANVAHADDYKDMDTARTAIVAALDAGDVAGFGLHAGTDLELERVWFDKASCRKKFGTAKIKKKQVPALVKCFAGLKVWQQGLNIYYGPGVLLSAHFEVVDGTGYVTRMTGDVTPNARLPYISIKTFEAGRKAGSKTVAFDEAARQEIVDAGETKGVVLDVCVDAKGSVTRMEPWLVPLANDGPTVAQIRAAAKSWQFEPFLVRGKPAPVCAIEVIKLEPPP